MSKRFARMAAVVAGAAGSYLTFLMALTVVIIWAASGPVFGFSDTWQLVINTGTTVVTFLMVFLIQNTQHRDALAVHLKLDELISSIDAANDELMSAEDQTDAELRDLKARYAAICEEHERLKSKIGNQDHPIHKRES